MQYRNIDKQALKNNGYTALSKITIVGTNTVFTEDDHIVEWDYEDYRFVPEQGFVGQFVERILDGTLRDISENTILEDTEINLQLGIVNGLDNNTTTWYNYGNFLVTKVEKEDTTGVYKFESADYTKKFNKVFDGDYTDTTYTKSFNDKMEDEETVTALWLAQYTCAQAGVVLHTTNFTNYDFVISSNQYDSDATCRKVMQDIGKLAYSWVRIAEDNKVHIDFTPKATSSVDTYDTLTTDEYYVSKKSDLTFGPVNKVLIGMADIDGENMYETSQDYTPETECAIKIWDNNLTNTEELRALALEGCDRLFGITYTPLTIDTVGHPWLEGDELIKLTNVDGVVLYTYPFNRSITYKGYIEGSISSDVSTKQNTKYEYKSDIISTVKKTTVEVDKQNQTITALAENVSENTSNISTLNITVNGIEQRVTSVESTEVVAVTNEYAVNTSPSTAPTSGWSTTKPTRQEGQYIWARIKSTYKNGNVVYSDPVNTTGDKGDPGAGGKGISSINNYYKTTSTQTQPSASSITSTTIPTMDATDNKYLWQKEVITYTDNTNKTTVNLIGVYGNTGQQGPQGETGQTGATGATGNGIQSITYYYKATSTQSAPTASSITSTTIPTLDGTTNKYLWQKEVIKYTDTSVSDKVTVLLAGVYGDTGQQGQTGPAGADGKGISSVTYYYKATSTQSTPSASSVTSTTIPTLDGTTNKYLWQKEVIAYTTGDPKTTVALIGVYGDKGQQGETGATGNGISSITYYYATTTTQSAPSAASITSTTIPTLSATNKYLWQKEVIAYTNNTNKTSVLLIAVYGDKGDKGNTGDDGASIDTITEYYAVSSSNTTAPSSWTTDVSSITLTATNKYLWNYTRITYTEGKEPTGSSGDAKVIGVYGDKGQKGDTGSTGPQGPTGPAGEDGDDGRGIVSITEYYLATSASSGVTRSTSGWTTTIQTMTSTNKYLWNYEKIVYTSGTTTEYVEPMIIGVYGLKGDPGTAGKGIQSVTELYYVSNSSTAPSKPSSHVTTSSLTTYNAWNLQCPPYTTTYKYFYTCSEVLYTDNTYGWTNVTQNQALAIANENAYNATQTANSADSKATSAKTYTDAVSSQYGYRYKKDIVIYGDAENKFYPVYFGAGNQNVPRELMIIRGYSEQAPASWNTSTHKGGLMFRAKANYGGWGGVTYSVEILDFTELYSNMIADIKVEQLSGYGCTVWMRGGGTTGAIYHVYSDQPIDATISNWHCTLPFIGTTAGAVIGYYGGDTPETATQKWLVANPLNAPDTVRLTSLQTKKALNSLSTYVDTNIENLQSQIDGAIQFWNGSAIPTLNNYPANQWTTEADRVNHQADIYTVIQDVSGELKQGKSYRFDKVSGTWQWIELTDNELSAVQALASSKAKVFVTTPTVPYNIGDLWLNNNKLYRCKTAKTTGQSYSSSDWQLATDYTNDDTANTALNKITNLVIGGRNYFMKKSTNTTYTNGAFDDNYEYTLNDYQNTGGFTQFGNLSVPMSEFVGQEIIMTFEMISPNGAATLNVIYNSNGNPRYLITNSTLDSNSLTTEWKKITAKFTVIDNGSDKSEGPSNKLEVYVPSKKGCKIRKVKVEIGNKATDWTTAPEDDEINMGYYIQGTQTTNTRFWTGNAPFNKLTPGQQIVYWNPRNTNTDNGNDRVTGVNMRVSSSVTKAAGTLINSFETGTSYNNVWLNLTLPDGSETGWIPCYYGSGATRLTTHYNGGRNIRFTYLVNANVGGEATTNQYTGWFAEAGYNSDTYDRIRYNSNIVSDQMYLNVGRIVGSTDNGYIEINRNCTFRYDKPILYIGSAIGISNPNSNNYISISGLNITNNLNGSNLNNADNILTSAKTFYRGIGVTGTNKTPQVFSGSGVTTAAVGDYYRNSQTGYMYICTVGGNAATAKWGYIVWYRGTAITGTSTTATVFSGSGISAAVAGDFYMNTSTGNVYNCTLGGNAATAKWVYMGTCIKPVGKRWYSGTSITGTGTNRTGYAGTAGDYYLNTSTGYYYLCNTTGTASTAKWNYIGILTQPMETLYLRGMINGNYFTVADVPFTTRPTAPTSDEDDFYYMAIGSTYSIYQYGLFPEHPIFKYVNGEFKSLSEIASNASDNVESISKALSSYVTTETYTAGLANTAEELKSWSRGELVTTSDFGTYSQYMEGQLSQKAGITEISSTATQIVNDAMSGISETISNVEETFTFDTNGLKIARGGNSIYLQLQNDELAFRTDNTDGGKKAYMTSNAFVLNQLSELRLGNFGFVVRANGSVDFKKVK